MPSVNNSRKGVNSGTSLQATLKNNATTYFAKVDIGSAGSGTLDQTKGQSKGILAFNDAATLQESGSYIFIYEAQDVWLGSPSVSWVSGGINANPANGEYFAGRVVAYEPAQDVSAFNIDGVTTAGLIGIKMYHISGSSVSEVANPPSGSSIYLTVVGTKSPVF